MSKDLVSVKFRCQACNQATELSLPDNATDDSIAVCKNCGQQFGRYGDIKAKAAEEVAKRLGWPGKPK